MLPLLRLSTLDIRPAVAIPFQLLQHQGTELWFYVLIMTVVEYVVAIIYGKDLAAMAGAIEEIALFACYNRGCIAFGQGATLSISEYAGQFATSAYKEFVGVISVPAGTNEHIPIAVTTV